AEGCAAVHRLPHAARRRADVPDAIVARHAADRRDAAAFRGTEELEPEWIGEGSPRRPAAALRGSKGSPRDDQPSGEQGCTAHRRNLLEERIAIQYDTCCATQDRREI